MYDTTTCQQTYGGFAGMHGCPSGSLLCLIFTQWPSKCPPIAQPDVLSWTSSLPASGSGLCNFKPLATRVEDVEEYIAKRWSPLIAFGHVFQAGQPTKNNNKNHSPPSRSLHSPSPSPSVLFPEAEVQPLSDPG